MLTSWLAAAALATGFTHDVEIMTVDGALLATPSFTINCAIYVPALSATKVGETALAPVNVAMLPAGRVSVQAYVSGFPLPLVDPLPLRTTVAPTVTV